LVGVIGETATHTISPGKAVTKGILDVVGMATFGVANHVSGVVKAVTNGVSYASSVYDLIF
jgi:hypothetical protein